MGRYLEGRAKAKASKALDALLDLQPPTVQIWQHEIWTEMPLAAAQVGDRLLIRPGEQIPLDATILEGESEVDEQLLTGESLPQHKLVGDPIWAARSTKRPFGGRGQKRSRPKPFGPNY